MANMQSKKGIERMKPFLSHVINVIAAQLEGVQALVLRGSQQTDSVIDLWSDTDLVIILKPLFCTNETDFVRVINSIGFVIGCEMYKYSEHSMLYRTAIDYEYSIHMLDTQICSYGDWIFTESKKDQPSTVVYGNIELDERITESARPCSFHSYNSSNTWFKYFMAIKKFARNDNLIGLHLLLDLIREYLVIEMMERDIRQGTNIHRLGYGEQLPDTIKLSQIDVSDKKEIYDYIARLA